jgi:hypothetical protein
MLLARLGSLNALEQTCGQGIWRRILQGRHPPSADTLARVSAKLDPDDIRGAHAHFYARLKRNKALPAPRHGLIALVIDGHESSTSYRRCCRGCRVRTITTKSGDRTQYYHRYVAAVLVGDGFEMLLDVEPQQRGEDEVAAALRLLERVHRRHPRAFDVVVADSLYARTTFFRKVLELNKDAQAVLKREDWTLTQEVDVLCRETSPEPHKVGATDRQCWDLTDLPWSDFDGSVRVVRSVETTRVRRQLTGRTEEVETTWMWVTTLPPSRASTRTVVDLGHRRWAIENEGFNEAVNVWHMDHVYHHEPNAMLVMLLLAMIAYNLLHVFYARNIKPELRRRASFQHITRQITADLYAPRSPRTAPT